MTKEKKKSREEAKAEPVIAKKDFEIHWNEYHLVIKAGETLDLAKIPEPLHQNLMTEGVIQN